MYHPSQIQFQPSMPQQQQQQQPYFPQHQQQVLFQQSVQRPTSPSVIHYLPNNTNQATFVPQTQQFPVYQTNGTDHMPQQFLERMNIWNLSDENPTQTNTDVIQQPMATDEVEKITRDYSYRLCRCFCYF
jgi:hypothetical protein